MIALSADRMKFEYKSAENKTVKLTFVELHDIAEVYVNGESVGKLIFKPYEADITKYLHDGENEISVKVFANNSTDSDQKGFAGATVRI